MFFESGRFLAAGPEADIMILEILVDAGLTRFPLLASSRAVRSWQGWASAEIEAPTLVFGKKKTDVAGRQLGTGTVLKYSGSASRPFQDPLDTRNGTNSLHKKHPIICVSGVGEGDQLSGRQSRSQSDEQVSGLSSGLSGIRGGQ